VRGQAKQEEEDKQAASQKRIERFGKVEAAPPKAGTQVECFSVPPPAFSTREQEVDCGRID
jgi:hypothetical protein